MTVIPVREVHVDQNKMGVMLQSDDAGPSGLYAAHPQRQAGTCKTAIQVEEVRVDQSKTGAAVRLCGTEWLVPIRRARPRHPQSLSPCPSSAAPSLKSAIKI